MKLSNNTDFFHKKGIEIHSLSAENNAPSEQSGTNSIEKKQRVSSAEITT